MTDADLAPHAPAALCRPRRWRAALAAGAGAVALAAAGVVGVALAQAPAASPSASQAAAMASRAAARIAALQREADALASREQSLLGDLRALEVERDLQAARLEQVQADLARLEAELADASARITTIEAGVRDQLPGISARLVELYKLGSGGYLRLLLNVDDVRSMGRAYRFVSALQRVDRLRIADHQRALADLRQARASLTERRDQLLLAQQEAVQARTAAARSAAAHEALIRRIDARRDLAAQLAGELRTATDALQRRIDAVARGDAASASGVPVLPLRPFKGDLDWPAPGAVASRFGGRRDQSAYGSTTSNGIRIAAPPYSPVRAIHDGTVIFAGPFQGFGTLVIVDHGAFAFSLYGFLADLGVSVDRRVARGDVVGSTGLALDGTPALYFELRIDAAPVDPLQWLKQR